MLPLGLALGALATQVGLGLALGGSEGLPLWVLLVVATPPLLQAAAVGTGRAPSTTRRAWSRTALGLEVALLTLLLLAYLVGLLLLPALALMAVAHGLRFPAVPD